MSWAGEFFSNLSGALWDAEKRRALLRQLRKLLRASFVCFLICAVVLLLVVEWVGERNLFTVFFLFLPPQIWFLPLAAFGAAALCLWDWRVIVSVMASGGVLVLVYLDWEIPGTKKGRGGEELVVMTFNRGQRSGSLQPFKERHRPDVIAMQEAARRSKRYLKSEGYTDFAHGDDIGEFMLLSKYPIVDKGLLEFDVYDRRHRPAAWFVIEFAGEEIVVYNVHMHTPRDQLRAMRRGAFLRGLWPVSPAAKSYQRWWNRQIEIARLLREHIEAESRPVIVVGDFNTPDHGYIYRQFRGPLQDAHEKAGQGFGWTFPGKTRNPLSLFGPWLRIDHQFADRSWRVLACHAESGRKSQHLAVVARYERVGR